MDGFRQEFPALAAALAPQLSVERELGRGGMGVVYLARDLMLDRLVALKVLPPALAAQPETRERFLREARTAARLSHPNIVPVYRADEIAGTAFFTMKFVDGESLADRLRDRGTLPPADLVRLLREVAWALAYAHARGVVHRDIKPENIFIDRDSGRALVGDFGIARAEDSVVGPAADRLTAEGLVLGTVHYMSPEQVAAEPLDGRSDLYALGVVAFQALSGRLPFEGLPIHAVLVAHASRPAPRLRDVAPDVPPALAAVVDRCLAKAREDRYATGEALADALTAARREVPPTETQLPQGMPDVISESHAMAIWQRAAQLQSESLRHLESRRELLAPSTAADASLTRGYRLRDVVDAAADAGIPRQYVTLAMAELPRGGLDAAPVPELAVSERSATRFLGTDERSLAVSRTVAGAPRGARPPRGAVLQRSPFDLQLRETVGPHPLDGGVLVFDLPGPAAITGAPAAQVAWHWMALRHQLEARQLQVTLRAVQADGERTEVALRCDLRPGVRRNVLASRWIAGSLAGTGGALTSAVLAKGAALLLSAAVLLPAAGVAAGLGAVSLFAYRRLYRSTLAKARAELERALDAVAAAVQSEAVFGQLPEPRTRVAGPPGHDDGDASAAASFITMIS
jgi:serine/threonine protein kinase